MLRRSILDAECITDTEDIRIMRASKKQFELEMPAKSDGKESKHAEFGGDMKKYSRLSAAKLL